jgi:hypothetical protein
VISVSCLLIRLLEFGRGADALLVALTTVDPLVSNRTNISVWQQARRHEIWRRASGQLLFLETTPRDLESDMLIEKGSVNDFR